MIMNEISLKTVLTWFKNKKLKNDIREPLHRLNSGTNMEVRYIFYHTNSNKVICAILDSNITIDNCNN